MLIKDIQNQDILNRLIPPQFQERRSNCKMRCQNGDSCHFCRTMTYFTRLKTMKKIKEQLEQNND